MSIIDSLLMLREDSVSDDTKTEGVMIAFYPPVDICNRMKIEGGLDADDMHVTLAYLGKRKDIGSLEELKEKLRSFTENSKPLSGKFSGLGRFNGGETSDNKDVLYASLDLPALPSFRHELIELLKDAGSPASEIHGFTPHMTITYFPSEADLPVQRLDSFDVTFKELFLVVGEKKIPFSLSR